MLDNLRSSRALGTGDAAALVLPDTRSVLPTLPENTQFCDAPLQREQLAAIPGLNSKVKREVMDGLAVVKFRNDTMAGRNGELTTNVVPQLVRLLANTDEEIPQLAMARLVAIGADLTAENRTAATTALEAYRKRNTDPDIQKDIDAALKIIRPPTPMPKAK